MQFLYYIAAVVCEQRNIIIFAEPAIKVKEQSSYSLTSSPQLLVHIVYITHFTWFYFEFWKVLYHNFFHNLKT